MHTYIFFRFDVEICNSVRATQNEILKKVPGKFGIFCNRTTPINEDIIKAAGKKLIVT